MKGDNIMKNTNLTKTFTIALAIGSLACFIPEGAQAGSWGLSLTPGGVGVSYGGRHGSVYVGPAPVYYDTGNYYPTYRRSYYPTWNPVERRDIQEGGYYAPDGTYHGGTTVEDRHSSYYSPGRNDAITPPRTTVNRHYGPGYVENQERTSWIGADGRPHSTTVTETTTQDPWGNTHTDTHVSLKNKKGSSETQKTPLKPMLTAPQLNAKEAQQAKTR
jgi:hypothetical protein